MPAIGQVFALTLALVLAAAALQKVWSRDRLAEATARLARVGPPIGATLSLAAGAVEAAAALALVFSQTRAIGAFLAAGLWSIYLVALIAARSRGEGAFDCGCSFGAIAKPVDGVMIARAASLASLAVAAGVWPATASFTAQSVFAALGLFTLYVTTGVLMALPPIPRSHAS